jgi:phosphoglycerate dehydrogenase-like enzyme
MKIALVGRLAAGCEQPIREALGTAHEVVVIPKLTDPGLDFSSLGDVEVIVGGPITTRFAEAVPNVRLFQAMGAGFNGLGAMFLPPTVHLANSRHHEKSIAEYVLMGMLWLNLRPDRYDSLMRQNDWTGACVLGFPPVSHTLHGQTLLILGVGIIGTEVALRARDFGMTVVGVSRTPEVPRPETDRMVGYADWEQELPSADHILVACPLTPATRGLIGAAQFAKMKPSVGIVNVGRANVLDEAAFFQALEENRIGGAVLDVWYRYPEEPGKPCAPARLAFHTCPNVLFTPHISAWTVETVRARVQDLATNIERLTTGEPLLNTVSRDLL